MALRSPHASVRGAGERQDQPRRRSDPVTIPDQPTLRRTATAGDILSITLGRARGWFSAGHWMPVLAVVIVAVPPLVLIGPLVTHGGAYSNWGDVAANELSVQNAAHLHQTLGPYDRFGWNHPGPIFFYLLAIPYVLMDWNGAALSVGAGLINLAAAIGIVGLVARRAGGKAALGTAAVVCAFESALNPPNITNSWGPEVIILPAALFFVLCADLAAGAVWSLAGAVAVGSFLAQTEVGTGSALAVGLLLAVVARGAAWLKAGTLRWSLRSSLWPALTAVIIGAVLWAPPIWQQLTNNPGNLGVLANTFLHTHRQHRPAAAVSALAAGIVDPMSGLIGNPSPGHPDVALALFLIGSGALAVVCWWRRQWLAVALAGGIPLVAGVCVLSFERVEGPIYAYLIWWTGALTACGWIALIICITAPARPLVRVVRWGVGARLLGAFTLAGCAIFSGWRLSEAASDFKSGGGYVKVIQASDAVERMLPRSADRVLVCVMSSAAWPESAGVVADLRKARRDARVNKYWLIVFGRELAPSGREQVAVFLDNATSRPRFLSVDPQRDGTGGGLAIRSFQPAHGYVSAAVCPQVH